MLKEKLDASAFAIVVSTYLKEFMVDKCGADARDKIHVIYGGIDTDIISPYLRELPSNGPFQILCVARFEEVKGHAYLVEACRLLQDRGVDFECHLIGDGEVSLRRTIEKQIARAGLGEKVRLHGSLTYAQVLERLSRADVSVLATVPTSDGKREGIPNVLKEAMACGIPVVSSSISGIPELVDHEASGLLVPPRDPSALADALQRLNDNPALRDRMGRAGREKIVREFSLRTNVARRVELFLNGTPD
jgi:glycosyltransferase involved in cell wall biosynthesis